MLRKENHVDKIIYLDNAATSWPKPAAMLEAMSAFSSSVGANPGRSGHTLSIEAARIVLDAREALAQLLGIRDMLRVAFTKNATEALNIAILGLLGDGGHAITSAMEHNSVMRPLRFLESKGVQTSVVPCASTGELDPQDILPLIRKDTKAVIITHASNVTGTIMPIARIGALCRERGIVLCVDASQTAGAVPIDVEAMNLDVLAFTGHKALLGPQGTGGLYLRKGLESRIPPLMHGGTGSRSEFETQPDFMPDRYESGTPNTIGLAGLGAGVRYLLERGVDAVRGHEMGLTARLIAGLSSIPGVTVHGVRDAARQTAVVSFTMAGTRPSDIVLFLDADHGIMARPGLHCAPSAHRTIGTFPDGTVRFSPGSFTTASEIDAAIQAVAGMAERMDKENMA
ncbi:MAG TPA: aminotransferase class V-fold PLP-dependent enzyme [Deltaproteobacteria bacterium]|nr:aminotransferase class V-fold PLP-dependent enzyme [Deltaproteobacteria bacterium]